MDLDGPLTSPARHPAGAGRAATLAVALLALAGCGIRVETPPPPAPVPGPLEVVRQETAETSAALAADVATVSEATLDESFFAILERVRLEAEDHVEALGGVYSIEEGGVIDTATSLEGDDVSDDESDEESDDGSDDEEPVDPVTPADLVLSIAEAAAAARGAADRVDDAPLAQLFAVIATSRLLA